MNLNQLDAEIFASLFSNFNGFFHIFQSWKFLTNFYKFLLIFNHSSLVLLINLLQFKSYSLKFEEIHIENIKKNQNHNKP